MTPAALALVLGAALLHAIWNALAKRAAAPLPFLWSSVSLASLLLSPFGLWVARREGLPAGALGFVLATVLLHGVYFYALGRAYRAGDAHGSIRSRGASGSPWSRCSPGSSSRSASPCSGRSASPWSWGGSPRSTGRPEPGPQRSPD